MKHFAIAVLSGVMIVCLGKIVTGETYIMAGVAAFVAGLIMPYPKGPNE